LVVHQNLTARAGLRVAAIIAIALTSCFCNRQQTKSAKHITPEYDPTTGKLTLLKYDSNANGVVDTWSYMDGARLLRIEIDKDEDGKIDRWEHYGDDRKLVKVGFSRQMDGREDAWSYAAPDGSIERIEVSTRRDGKVTRVEHYRNDVIVAAEEDTDEDGRPDKWETYEGTRLAMVAFDTRHRGAPDRRLIYGADGTVRVEADKEGGARE
jgi:hypothetical protein